MCVYVYMRACVWVKISSRIVWETAESFAQVLLCITHFEKCVSDYVTNTYPLALLAYLPKVIDSSSKSDLLRLGSKNSKNVIYAAAGP